MIHRAFSLLIAASFCIAGNTLAQDTKPEKVLFVCNSITRHGPAPKIGWTGNWGMAASAEAKDYVHLVVDAVTKLRGQKPEFLVENVADFERAYATFDLAAKLKEEAAFQPDTIVLAIGENVPVLKTDEEKTKFKDAVIGLLTTLKGDRKCTVYVRSCFWGNEAKDAALKEACTAVGGVFVDIGTLGKEEMNYARSERKFENDGVARHPGDRGMQAIADAIAAAMQKKAK